MSALLVDAGWDNNEPTPIFWDAVNHLFGEGSTPTLPPTGPPPAWDPEPAPECECAMTEASLFACPKHGLDAPDPDATDTQVLEALEPEEPSAEEWFRKTSEAYAETSPLPSRRPRDEHGRFLPKDKS